MPYNSPKSLGKHALFDVTYPIDHPVLLNPTIFLESMSNTCTETGATIVSIADHKFGEGGFTFAIILSESHASVHTWPEHGIACFDIFMCGKCDAFDAMSLFLHKLELQDCKPDTVYQTKHFRGFV